MKDTVHDDQTDSIPRMQGWFHSARNNQCTVNGKAGGGGRGP